MKKSLITVDNVSKQYGSFYAVKDTTISVFEGDIYGLIGKNGAGKTTLFKMLLGLTLPTNGTISINGSKNDRELRKERSNIGFFIGLNFFGYLTAHENIEYYRKLKGIDDPKETDRVLKIVGLFGETKLFKKFSMGMKQRLGIANALLGDPNIIILDEPVNGLDPQGIVDIRKIILDLNQNQNKTLVISSHILSELDLIATRFGIIDHAVLLKEVERGHFHKETVQRMIIHTNNDALFLEYLEQRQDLKAQLNEKGILVQADEVTTTDLIHLAFHRDLEVIEVYKANETLEEYFFALTGGQANV